jgi:hypothetical protein
MRTKHNNRRKMMTTTMTTAMTMTTATIVVAIGTHLLIVIQFDKSLLVIYRLGIIPSLFTVRFRHSTTH